MQRWCAYIFVEGKSREDGRYAGTVEEGRVVARVAQRLEPGRQREHIKRRDLLSSRFVTYVTVCLITDTIYLCFVQRVL